MKIAGVSIKGISCNSKNIKKGFAFVAIKGQARDGGKFIGEAIANGASVVAAEKGALKGAARGGVKFVEVKDCRRFLAQSCAEFFGHPSRSIKVIGITGTNGKTTVSYLIEAIAREAGHSCGVIGTVNYRFKGRRVPALNTTPGPAELHALLAGMRKGGARYCAMEVSSHALDQGRVSAVDFRQAVFTNLTQDHLDYHKDMESYFLAKSRLFRMLSRSASAIVNNDDKYGRRIARYRRCRTVTYGIRNNSTFMAKEIEPGITGTSFILAGPGVRSRINTRLIGMHNIYNILAAASWAVNEGIGIGKIRAAIEKFRNVPGRLEKTACVKGGSVFIDYAHTPDALLNVIGSLKPLVAGRIILVFGCGGERDKLKRPKMGRIATELADRVIITSDNPRSENPLDIIGDIRRGIRRKNYSVIADRFGAIKEGLRMLGKGDCLLIAGKGHEQYQVYGGVKKHFSDREAVQKCLRRKR
jgi:UDP-N-acetylmuramoyl-L-alanyl-D-glutamate--2,6-diaminopimelate ligase